MKIAFTVQDLVALLNPAINLSRFIYFALQGSERKKTKRVIERKKNHVEEKERQKVNVW